MLVTLSAKLTREQRDAFGALADNLNMSSSALLRAITVRYIESGEAAIGGLATTIQTTQEDVTRILVLARFLAEDIDKETTDILLERTETYLASLSGKPSQLTLQEASLHGAGTNVGSA
jgi:hypothetical protein